MKDQTKAWLRGLSSDEVERLLTNGIVCVNEIRFAHDLPPIEGGSENTVFTANGPVRLSDVTRPDAE